METQRELLCVTSARSHTLVFDFKGVEHMHFNQQQKFYEEEKSSELAKTLSHTTGIQFQRRRRDEQRSQDTAGETYRTVDMA